MSKHGNMSTALHTETYQEQSKLAGYCRSGKTPEIKGVTPNRLHHYRRLVYNVVKDALASSYPLAVNLLNEKEWENLCQEFFENHACQDPQVWKMPFELIGYLEPLDHPLKNKYPHLMTLLLFEWKEVEYYMMPDRIQPSPSGTDIWSDAWALNAEAEVMTLEYPVHLKNARFISRTDSGQYFCLIFRQPVTGKVKFMNLSPFFAWLLAAMMANATAPEELFPVIQNQFGISDKDFLLQNISPLYQKLKQDGFLIF